MFNGVTGSSTLNATYHGEQSHHGVRSNSSHEHPPSGSEPGSIGGEQTICVGDTPSILTNVVSATVSGTFATDGQYKWQ